MDSYKLQVLHISKSFPGVLALDDISLNARRGSVLVLCGENGAGKSTLMKIIDGVYQPDKGEILIDGKKVHVRSPIHARKFGISMIFQELNYIPEMTVEESLFCGRLPTRAGRVDWKTVRRRTVELLERENLPYSPTMRMKDLSVSDIQMLEILKAISRDASIIIMDEPTSAITQREVERLFSKIAELKARGTCIIYISHKMDEIFRIADDIAILRDGRVVESRPRGELDIDKVISLMVGRKLESNFPKRQIEIGEEALRVEKLTAPGVFKDISFSVRAGEIVGFAGLMGAGRTEVMRAVFGLDRFASGEIRVRGRRVADQLGQGQQGGEDCDAVGRPAEIRTDVRAQRAREHLAPQPAAVHLSRTPAWIEGNEGRFRHLREVERQDALAGHGRRGPERREPAEGRAREMDAQRAGRSHHGRTDAGHRRRVEIRDLQTDG